MRALLNARAEPAALTIHPEVVVAAIEHCGATVRATFVDRVIAASIAWLRRTRAGVPPGRVFVRRVEAGLRRLLFDGVSRH